MGEYKIGDRLKNTSGADVAGHILAGEEVTVLGFNDTGMPVVGTDPDPDTGIGRNMSLDEDTWQAFGPA